MSKIVSPYPPIYDLTQSPDAEPGACWWELKLEPNEDGHLMVLKSDAKYGDITTATWCEWEFFDGYNTFIDTGLDKPTRVYIDNGRRYPGQTYIAVFGKDPPTPAPGWRKLEK